MKSGLAIGQAAEFEILVTKDMRAEFVGVTVHELYSTSDLVNHIEWAARKVLIPYLESYEESMVSHVEVSHLTLTVPGMTVRVKATVSEIRDKKIVCDVEAFNTRGKIARGTVTQSIIEKSWLDKKMKELSIINQLSLQFNEASVSSEQSKP